MAYKTFNLTTLTPSRFQREFIINAVYKIQMTINLQTDKNSLHAITDKLSLPQVENAFISKYLPQLQSWLQKIVHSVSYQRLYFEYLPTISAKTWQQLSFLSLVLSSLNSTAAQSFFSSPKGRARKATSTGNVWARIASDTGNGRATRALSTGNVTYYR